MTTPAISGVSGAVATGQTLTITGTNFVNESTINWDDFFINNPNASGFEGANPGADGYGALGPAGGSYVTDVKLMGSKSMRFNVSSGSASVSCPADNLSDYNAINPEGDNNSDYWIRLYSRWSLDGGGWPTSHIKMIDCQQSPFVTNQYYFQPKHDAGGNLPSNFDAAFDGTSHDAAIPSGQLENGRWYGIELHWKTTSNQVGQIYDAWIDGTQVTDSAPIGETGANFILFGIINTCGYVAGFDLKYWIDGFAISSSRVNLASVVEIGNNSDYATATKNYQQPATLSETSNVVKCHLTNPNNLGAGPYWLWVTNNLGQRSDAFRMDGGGGATVVKPWQSANPDGGLLLSGRQRAHLSCRGSRIARPSLREARSINADSRRAIA